MTGVATSSMTIQGLMAGVQRALRALVPIADELGVRWREPENYLEWDSVALGVFEGFALAAIRSSVGWTNCVDLIAYDKRVADYNLFSYVAVESHDNHLPFICLETMADPFDTCLVAALGADSKVKGYLRIPFREARFVAVGRLSTGTTTTTDAIAW